MSRARSIALLCASLLVFAPQVPQSTFAQDGARTLSVSQSATVLAQPDAAVLKFLVSATEVNAKNAREMSLNASR